MLEAVTRASFYSKTVTSSYESTVMGKKRKPASTRTATPVGDDIATATRSAYEQGVEANKAQNQLVLDALKPPERAGVEGAAGVHGGADHAASGISRRNNSGWLFWAGDGVAAV